MYHNVEWVETYVGILPQVHLYDNAFLINFTDLNPDLKPAPTPYALTRHLRVLGQKFIHKDNSRGCEVSIDDRFNYESGETEYTLSYFEPKAGCLAGTRQTSYKRVERFEHKKGFEGEELRRWQYVVRAIKFEYDFTKPVANSYEARAQLLRYPKFVFLEKDYRVCPNCEV